MVPDVSGEGPYAVDDDDVLDRRVVVNIIFSDCFVCSIL
jgi:hypothetical protein